MSVKRVLRKLLPLAAMVLALILAVPSAAYADVITSGGPPAGGGNSGNPNTPGSTFCELDATGSTIGVLGGRTIYIAPYAGCNGVGVGHSAVGTWGGTAAWGLCLSSYVVWDFYGNESGPADGVTISSAYLPRVCDSAGPAGINTTTALSYQQIEDFSPNPLDNGYTSIFSSNQPYLGAGGLTGTGSYYVQAKGTGHDTSSSPFWAAGLPCNNMTNNPDPLVADLSYPNSNASNLIWGAVNGWLGPYGSQVANALGDTVNASGPGSLNYQSINGAYPRCTSGLTMDSIQGNPNPNIYASCSMPVSMLATGYQSNRYGYAAVYPAVGGYRWDVAPGEGLGANNNLTLSEAQNIRNWIYNYDPPINVGSAYPAAYYRGGMTKAQALANVPAWTRDSYFEPALYATCFRGWSLPGNVLPPNTIPAPAQHPSLSLSVTAVAPSLIVGGQINPGHFAAAYNNDFSCIDCSAGPGSTPPRLLKLTYNLAVTGTNGYTECTGGNVTGCQYETISDTAQMNGSIETSTTHTAGFFNATNPPGSSTGAQAINLALTNVIATYQYSWFDGNAVQTKTGTVPVTLNGANISRPVIGGTQTP